MPLVPMPLVPSPPSSPPPVPPPFSLPPLLPALSSPSPLVLSLFSPTPLFRFRALSRRADLSFRFPFGRAVRQTLVTRRSFFKEQRSREATESAQTVGGKMGETGGEKERGRRNRGFFRPFRKRVMKCGRASVGECEMKREKGIAGCGLGSRGRAFERDLLKRKGAGAKKSRPRQGGGRLGCITAGEGLHHADPFAGWRRSLRRHLFLTPSPCRSRRKGGPA